MMFSKSFFTFALVAASAQFASATPPGCLLGAVNTQPNPADLASICGPNASKVQAQIRSLCGANTAEAMSAFSSICASAGHNVVTHKPSASKTATHKATIVKTATHKQPVSKTPKKTGGKTTIIKTASHKTAKAPKPTHHVTGGNQNQSTVKNTKTAKKSIMTASGGAGGSSPKSAGQQAVTTPSAPASSTAPPKYSGAGAAGRVDAEGFASLALAAAGLAIFL